MCGVGYVHVQACTEDRGGLGLGLQEDRRGVGNRVLFWFRREGGRDRRVSCSWDGFGN